jgi:hypothetical protein
MATARLNYMSVGLETANRNTTLKEGIKSPEMVRESLV